MTPPSTDEPELAEPEDDRVDPTEVASVFRVLGDPTRIRILLTLLSAGEACVHDVADSVGSPESTVSHALGLLRRAGVVANRRDGRTIYYSLSDDHVRDLLVLTINHVGHRSTPL